MLFRFDASASPAATERTCNVRRSAPPWMSERVKESLSTDRQATNPHQSHLPSFRKPLNPCVLYIPLFAILEAREAYPLSSKLGSYMTLEHAGRGSRAVPGAIKLHRRFALLVVLPNFLFRIDKHGRCNLAGLPRLSSRLSSADSSQGGKTMTSIGEPLH